MPIFYILAYCLNFGVGLRLLDYRYEQKEKEKQSNNQNEYEKPNTGQ